MVAGLRHRVHPYAYPSSAPVAAYDFTFRNPALRYTCQINGAYAEEELN